MLATAFDQFFPAMDFNKLHCQTAAFNTASARLLVSLGMTRDAVLREHHELDGRLHDDYVFSILRREWADRKR
jgi:ribosomal-protein-alanine N-acetyltransferase